MLQSPNQGSFKFRIYSKLSSILSRTQAELFSSTSRKARISHTPIFKLQARFKLDQIISFSNKIIINYALDLKQGLYVPVKVGSLT